MENQKLDDLSIFELRDLARKAGVFNPTVLKKFELINAINDIKSGKVKPYVAKTKQGRPPKVIGGYEKLVNIFLPTDISAIQSKEESIFANVDDPTITFCQNPILPAEDNQIVIYKGYLEILENGCGFLRKKITREDIPKNMCFIPSINMEKLALRNGDEILCSAYIVSPNKPMVIQQIKEINGVDINLFNTKRLNYDDIEYNTNSQLILFKDKTKAIFSKTVLKYGDTIFAYTDSENDFTLFSLKFIDSLRDSFDNFIYLSPSVSAKDCVLLKTIPAELYTADFNDSFSVQKRVGFLALNRAKRLVEMGKKVCFIVNNIMTTVGLDKNSSGELPISKYILSCAKNTDKGSITILCGIPPIQQPYLNNLIMTTFPIIETVGLKVNGIEVDETSSYRK